MAKSFWGIHSTSMMMKVIYLACIMFSCQTVTAEINQNELQRKISTVEGSLKNSRKISEKLKKSVHLYEDKLNKLSQELHHTEKKVNSLTTKLVKSNKSKEKLLKQTDEQKVALAQQMQALYTSGKQSHLRLLLKQDDPSDISRTVKYFEYLNQHRLKRIRVIKKKLEKIKNIQTQINTDTDALNKLQQKQSTKKKSLKEAVRKKDRALKKQHKIVKSQKKNLNKLKKQELRLIGKIKQLALKRKQEAQKEVARKAKEKAAKEAKKVAKVTTKKKKIKAKQSKIKTAAKHRYVPNKPFSSLKGKLSWPVRGSITQKFGSTRNSKQSWKGVIISASGGTNVHAVARGKVEFSGRFNGYGYLIIIRHDKNYRSLYAYNRSVYKKEGQIVKAGEIIAAVGNSGGQSKTGLYFEIRRGTSYQNPARWCR